LIEEGQLADAIEDAIDGERVEAAVRRAIDSEVADRVWEDILASDKAQMLVERIAEAPEVRVALASQGVGLISDLGRQVSRAAAVVDDFLERLARRIFRRRLRSEPTDRVGLFTRLLALAVDAGIVAAGFAIVSTLVSGVVSLFVTVDTVSPLFAGALSIWALAVCGIYLVGFWAFEGQTPGMRFLGIHVEHDGDPDIGLRRAFRRLWGTGLAILPLGLGFVPVLFDPGRRGLQDRIAGTEVVRRSNRVLAPWAENRAPGDPG
jgi:uncharacterized RDD family membrane protein YckC